MFAYELNGVSVAFVNPAVLGDSIIAKKIFEAIVELESNCHADIFYTRQMSKCCAEAFYGGNKNLNQILPIEIFNTDFQKYDLVWTMDTHAVNLKHANLDRLSTLSPKLYQSVLKVQDYCTKYIYNRLAKDVVLFNMARARILGTNRFTCMSCDDALPIYDNHVEINLLPEWETEFKKLGLKKYITVGTNGGGQRHTIKEWPTRYYEEFIALIKSRIPDIEVVQTGGGGGYYVRKC